EAARAAGARKAIPLSVSVAAHSPLMRDAAPALERALATVPISRPEIPFASSTEGRFIEEPDEIREALVRALTSPVDWPRCVQAISGIGVRGFVEAGPGHVLTGLNKRSVPDAYLAAVGNHDEAIALANHFALEVSS